MIDVRQRPARVLTAPIYHQIAKSSAVFDAIEDEYDEITHAIIRCGNCARRLFDLQVTLRTVWRHFDDPVNETFLVPSRVCPNCRTRNERDVTRTPGIPLGDDGPWICAHCAESGRGGYLGRIESPRGRVIVRCRCKEVARVTAAHVYHSLEALNELKNVPF